MQYEIKLYDEVGDWGITAKEFTDQIPADATEITVRINTPGGSVGDGLAMYHYLKSHPANVTTIVDGYAASMGSIIALAGDVRQVYKSSMIMVHLPWGGGYGNADELREQADVLDEHTEALISIYEDATGMSADELKTLLRAETWMRGEAAIDYGFATELVELTTENKGRAAARGAFASMVSALTEGRELMGKQLTRKELEAKLEETGAKVEQASAEADAVKAEADAKIVQAKAEADAIAIERDEVSARLESAEAAMVEMKATVEAIRAELDATKLVADESAAQLATAKAALENPAVADAVLQDSTPEARAVIEDDLDKAEAALAQEKQKKTFSNELEEWESMKAGAERTSFWDSNKKKIFAQLEARNSKKGE